MILLLSLSNVSVMIVSCKLHFNWNEKTDWDRFIVSSLTLRQQSEVLSDHILPEIISNDCAKYDKEVKK